METVLDLQQAAAVRDDARYVMVSAGAGSGKTRVLIERIAYLIDRLKVPSSEILAATFTRKAATEITTRLRQRLGVRHMVNLRVGTIHSMALRFIRQYGYDSLKIPPNVTVYNDWETEWLAKDTAKLVKAPVGWREVRLDGRAPNEDSPHRRFWDVFRDRLRSNNALTYDDLIITATQLVPEIARQATAHILVDEVQDLDRAQWGFLLNLVEATGAKLFLVGDIDQSIYQWRGADPMQMLWFADKCEVHVLDNNYRSTPAIVVTAAQLIGHNENRIPKTMNAVRSDPGRCMTVSDVDSLAAAQLVDKISDHGKNQTAVLSRTHVLLVKLSQELDRLGVPHKYGSGENRVMASEDFRRLHSICKLLVNQYDNFAFSLCREILGVDDAEYLAILRESSEQMKSQLRVWLDSINPSPDANLSHQEYVRAYWRSFFDIGHKWQPNVLAESVLDLASNVMPEDRAERALSWLARYQGKTLQGYLDWITTYDLQEDVETDPGAGVQLMTVHAAKGLEWENVVLLGWNEGILPTKQSLDSGVHWRLEEERRLAYVAITRARDTLLITSRPPVTESESGKTYINPKSRFLDEIRIK